jgi:hypothetical protein
MKVACTVFRTVAAVKKASSNVVPQSLSDINLYLESLRMPQCYN